jgi:hypothetical protein
MNQTWSGDQTRANVRIVNLQGRRRMMIMNRIDAKIDVGRIGIERFLPVGRGMHKRGLRAITVVIMRQHWSLHAAKQQRQKQTQLED